MPDIPLNLAEIERRIAAIRENLTGVGGAGGRRFRRR